MSIYPNYTPGFNKWKDILYNKYNNYYPWNRFVRWLDGTLVTVGQGYHDKWQNELLCCENITHPVVVVIESI